MDAVKIKRLFAFPVCLALILILGIIYQPAISWLFSAWLNNEYYNHGLLLLPVSALLIWHKRSEIYRGEPELRHLIPLGAGFALYAGGVFLHQPTLFCCSLLLVSAGLALLFLGSGAKPLIFPIFLFAFAIPIPGFDGVAIPLQHLSALASSSILGRIGLPVSMDGNFVNLAGSSYWIAPACSGLNKIMPLFALTAILVYLAEGSTLKKLTLFAPVIPIVLLSNIVRICFTLLIGYRFGLKAGISFYHTFSGILFFLVAVALVLLCARLLKLKLP